jgi:hypothetical protein
VQPKQLTCSGLLTIFPPQVAPESFEDQIGLAVSAVVKRLDDPSGAVSQIIDVGGRITSMVEVLSERIELAAYVVVLFSDTPDAGSEPPRILARDQGQQRSWSVQLSLFLDHGCLERTQTRLQVVMPGLAATGTTKGILDLAHADQGPVPLYLS